MRISRVIHPKAKFFWRKLSAAAPDMLVQTADGEEPMALMFTDPDGETHVFVFSEEGKQALVKEITGGIVLAGLKPQ